MPKFEVKVDCDKDGVVLNGVIVVDAYNELDALRDAREMFGGAMDYIDVYRIAD